MTITFPSSFQIIKSRSLPPPQAVRFVLGEAAWLNDPEAWDRAKFVSQIEQAMIDSHGTSVQIDELLVGLLVTQVELYVMCWANIRTQGLVMTFNAGATPGKNLHIGMADRALRQVVKLLGELALTPNRRSNTKPTGLYDTLLAGP
jgi:phage terminase small subunit